MSHLDLSIATGSAEPAEHEVAAEPSAAVWSGRLPFREV